MSNAKSLIFVIFLLTFLISGTICGQLLVFPVWAAPMHPCFDGGCPGFRNCTNDPGALKATCCWKEPGVIPPEINCQTCNVNTDTGEFENCSSAASEGTPGSGVIAPPPSGVAPPPSIETCPENTARDVNSNCTPLTQTPEESSPEGPTELTPQVDCNQTPDDPLCETASIPEAGDGGAAGAPPPVDEAAPPVDEVTQPPTLTEDGPPVCPEGQVLVEESGLCVLEDCPEGQILDEEAGLCVLEEPEVAEEEPAPICQEGLVLDEESNLCMLEEPEGAEDEPEQVEIDEPEQQSSEGDGSQDNDDN